MKARLKSHIKRTKYNTFLYIVVLWAISLFLLPSVAPLLLTIAFFYIIFIVVRAIISK